MPATATTPRDRAARPRFTAVRTAAGWHVRDNLSDKVTPCRDGADARETARLCESVFVGILGQNPLAVFKVEG